MMAMTAFVLSLLLSQGPPTAPRPSTGGVDTTKELFVDLANTPTGKWVTLPAPGSGFKIRLRNAAPSARYRVVIEIGAPHPSVRRLEVGMPTESMLRVMPMPNAACEQLQRQEHDLMRTTDESQVPAKVAVLEKALADQICPSQEMMTRLYIQRSQPLEQWVSLGAPDAPVAITIERVAPAAAAPKQWQVTTQMKTEAMPWRYASEEEWLVAAVSDRIARLLALTPQVTVAAVARPVPTAALQYTVTVKPAAAQTLTISDHIWSPRGFAPLALAVLGTTKGAASSSRSETSALPALLDLRGPTIQKENQRVSTWLGRERLNPAAHEQAALVVGALALRESAGDFWDARPLLNRMAAHLAVADALRGGAPASVDGQIAAAVLASVAGREKEALDRLALIKPATAGAPEAAWVRALTIRNTRDWRLLSEPTKATLLERLEHFRAIENALGAGPALGFLDARPPEPIVDWAYVALAKQASIEEGHRFAPSALDLQVAEIKEVHLLLRGRDLTTTALPTALNDQSPGSEVLDWATWAGFFERHVVHLVQSVGEFYQELGMPDDAERFSGEARAAFGALRLHPFNELRWAVQTLGDEGGRARIDLMKSQCRPTAALLRESPEGVAPAAWDVVNRMCRGEVADAAAVPAYDRWFQALTPYGTVLDPERRLMVPAAASRVDGRLAESLLALAPRQHNVVEYHINRALGAKATDEQLAAAYQALADYDVRALSRWAERVKDRPEAYQRVAGKMCELNADRCLDLAGYLYAREMNDAAAAAFERARRHGRDKVELSNSAEDTMHYYFDRGEVEKAKTLAEEAAGAGSYNGLVTMARWSERMGQYPEAESVYRQLGQRYENDFELNRFYIRREIRAKEGRYRALAAEALKEYFPAGLQRVGMGDFTAPPTFPIQALTATNADPAVMSESLRRFGIQVRDQIFAVDGYRVKDWAQYLVVRSLSDDPQMTAVVWRDGRYVEIKGRYPRRWFGK